jgi:hypothetical protein
MVLSETWTVWYLCLVLIKEDLDLEVNVENNILRIMADIFHYCSVTVRVEC